MSLFLLVFSYMFLAFSTQLLIFPPILLHFPVCCWRSLDWIHLLICCLRSFTIFTTYFWPSEFSSWGVMIFWKSSITLIVHVLYFSVLQFAHCWLVSLWLLFGDYFLVTFLLSWWNIMTNTAYKEKYLIWAHSFRE